LHNSSWFWTRVASSFSHLITDDMESFLFSDLHSFLMSSSLRFSKNFGTISIIGKKYVLTV
jgi:hypothetical protein